MPNTPKILIASLGTRGDVQPYVALAQQLVGLGAEVVVATGEGFEAMIEASGARAMPLPVNYESLLRDPNIKTALFSLSGILKTAKQSITLQQDIADTLWTKGLQEKPDLILFNLKACVMTLVARRLDVPAVPISLQPATEPTSRFPIGLFGIPDWGPSWNRKSFKFGRWLITKGMSPVLKKVRRPAATELAMQGSLIDGHMPDGSKALSLQAFSKALVPTPDDWSAHVWQTGYWFTEPDPDYVPPPALDAFLSAGDPPIYIGFGSMPIRDPETLSGEVFAALRKTGQRAILSKGWGGLAENELPSDLAGQVFLLDKAPHSWLFPRCRAVVHHGGAGTTHEALRWGKPSLVCPVFADQPYWAKRVHAIGAGPMPIKQKKLTTDALALALQDLVSGTYDEAAQAAAKIMASEPGKEQTAIRIKSLLETLRAPS